MIPIKQFGLQRSGTNIIKALIEINFKDTFVFSNYLGNKHDATSWQSIDSAQSRQNALEFGLTEQLADTVASLVNARQLPIIINVKDLVSWSASYFRYQQKKILFTNPQATFVFDQDFCDKCIDLWIDKMVSWQRFTADNSSNCVVVVHQNLLVSAKETLQEIERKFGLERSSDPLIEKLDLYAKRGTDAEHGKSLLNPYKKFDADYHLKNKWAEDVPAKQLSYLEQAAGRIQDEFPQLTGMCAYTANSIAISR